MLVSMDCWDIRLAYQNPYSVPFGAIFFAIIIVLVVGFIKVVGIGGMLWIAREGVDGLRGH